MLAMSLNVSGTPPQYSKYFSTLQEAMAKDMTGMVKSHLKVIDNNHANTLGGRRTHYWQTAAKATHWNVFGNKIVISINQVGVALHYYGGKVIPKIAKWLTIPASAEAYGYKARNFDLEYKLVGGKYPALVKRSESSGSFESFESYRKWKGRSKRRTGLYQVMFWLRKFVNIKADKKIIPDETALRGQAAVTLNRVISAIKSGGK